MILFGEVKVFEVIMWYLELLNVSNYEIKLVFSVMWLDWDYGDLL